MNNKHTWARAFRCTIVSSRAWWALSDVVEASFYSYSTTRTRGGVFRPLWTVVTQWAPVAFWKLCWYWAIAVVTKVENITDKSNVKHDIEHGRETTSYYSTSTNQIPNLLYKSVQKYNLRWESDSDRSKTKTKIHDTN